MEMEENKMREGRNWRKSKRKCIMKKDKTEIRFRLLLPLFFLRKLTSNREKIIPDTLYFEDRMNASRSKERLTLT